MNYIISRRPALLAALVVTALALIGALVLTHGSGSASAGAMAGLPKHPGRKVVRNGTSKGTFYYTPGSPNAASAPKPVTAKTASAADIRAGFSVLTRPQTDAEHNDPDIKQFVTDVPAAQLDGARALNAAHTVWVIPTNDGRLCIGMKLTTTPGATFTNACGPAENALTTGISKTYGDGLLALLPDDAHAGALTANGAKTSASRDVSSNYVWLPNGGTLTFTDASGEHTL